ncbi:hypothetical protein BO71DRAFT_67470 [Aspergillus ellipticus CBS 707.79]|uniref:Uncharacterized protein n=1 Tax=Aspergillus ellipticus CBS 707.79 TaxID=1448320 RepID=A0A319D174_9EURO|nr:hypothetical protein BO71DRAFT_67470 [Aspergillus ellipticus CBS 707.79]
MDSTSLLFFSIYPHVASRSGEIGSVGLFTPSLSSFTASLPVRWPVRRQRRLSSLVVPLSNVLDGAFGRSQGCACHARILQVRDDIWAFFVSCGVLYCYHRLYSQYLGIYLVLDFLSFLVHSSGSGKSAACRPCNTVMLGSSHERGARIRPLFLAL